MTAAPLPHAHKTSFELQHLFHRQRSAYLAAPMPDLSQRIRALKQLKAALIKNQDALCEALSKDFGHRSHQDTLISDILPCVGQINYTLKRLKKWMRPSRRHAGLLLAPAKVEVVYQPVGVVGIVVPWNFPVMLSIGPLIPALAAGNRAMLKLSEFTPATNQVLIALLASLFDDTQVTVVEGEADIAAAFTQLPFDHLLFTGSTAVGRHVMRAAADNLTPVTLELGGKSPTLIAPDAEISLAVERMIFGKCLNAGQICVAPDYVLVPDGKAQAFIAEFKKQFAAMYPQGVHSQDFTSVVNQRQFDRLSQWLEEARQEDVQIEPAHAEARDDQKHRMVPHLLVNPQETLTLMQEEIFGPLLPVITYQHIDEALQYIQQRPRPLALYLMSFDPDLQTRVKQEVHAGGMAINETVFHVAADDAPFGGIGPSGMGHYHGYEGFLTFSKAKTVLTRGRISTAKLVTPPYSGWKARLQTRMMAFFLR
ncbi:coniferyl aldehyde dehydrogenase [Photobacterium sp. GJ3]|uniref:coniferyl aldehyde dehydrogenase n=1 Tax=Photobacterium sp. GJ3 TaxID=2829502 RepID=UPI001B8ADD1D|nr:coniferyl aldehyde dehydrogenase [Photobacterium sp. GJ3]QUJ67363.1 coniferyl aldehyde dehydrogenase [Photobacterium sp. GJ3]